MVVQPGNPDTRRVPVPNSKRGGKGSPAWRNRALFQACFWGVFVLALLGLSTGLGGLAGFRSGSQERLGQATVLAQSSVDEQYRLGLQDLAEARYEVARQRFEYIISQDPSYPGATERLAEALAILYATATPSPLPPTATATPTPDLRPVEDLFRQAQTLLAAGDWSRVIDTVASLRKADPGYQTARADGMLFISLRQRGFDKIWKEGNLEGGIYDLALASRFAPLDAQSNSARELARLYIIGSSFWEVHPEQAVYFFSQVAAAAPGLRDISGWTASERYRAALIQYGDQFAKNKDWCNAQRQYELAMAIAADATLQQTLVDITNLCTPPTATITPTPEAPSLTPETPTAPPVFSETPTATQPFIPTTTDTPPVASPTTEPPPPPSDTPPAPSETPTQEPPPTDTLPAPTETPTETPTDTPPAPPQAPEPSPTAG